MSYQVYFLQDEDDAVHFIRFVSTLNVAIWIEKERISSTEAEEVLMRDMSSWTGQYYFFPEVCFHALNSSPEFFADEFGIQFSVCNKHKPLSRTYDTGRLYYRSNENNPYNAQMIELFKRLKGYIRKNYCYSKYSHVYFAPSFKQKYDSRYYFATRLGIPIHFCETINKEANLQIPRNEGRIILIGDGSFITFPPTEKP